MNHFKKCLGALLLFVVLPIEAEGVLRHTILEGKWHKKGIGLLKIKEKNPTHVQIDFNYKIKFKSFLVPSKFETGTRQFVVHNRFLSEAAYLDLEEKGRIGDVQLTFIHMGRVTWGEYYDCHRVKIVPHHKKWEAIILYHPDGVAPGWLTTQLIVKKNKLFKNYRINSQVK